MTVIVTDVHYRMSLAVLRDLHEAGHRLICCEREGIPAPLGFSSTAADETVTLPAETWRHALFHLCGQSAAGDGEKPALLPVGADTLNTLAQPETRQRFAAVCGLWIPTAQQLDDFNSKAKVAELAQSLGLPVPAAHVQREGEAVTTFAARLPYPVVVKPLCGEKLGLSASQRYAIARDMTAFVPLYERFRQLAGEPPLVQTYLPGGALGCSVLADHGNVVTAVCHRRVREYPVSGGPSACCDCIDAPQLVDMAAAMVKATQYTGLAMFEFKEDGDGKPHLLEINPRVWGTYPLTRRSGSRMSLLWAILAHNEGNPDKPLSLPPVPKPQPCRMHFTASDLCSAVGYAKRGQWGRALGTVGDLLRPAVKDGLWEWGDVKPGLLYYRSLLRR